MSFSEKAAKAEGAKAPVTQAPKSGIVKGSGNSSKTEEFRLKGKTLREGMSDDQRAQEGSKSDTVAFVATLANPAKPQRRKKGSEYIESKRPCGYQFKILEDTTVPVAPLKAECKSELDVELPATERPVKAGEIVSLNIIETAIFISRFEYAGTFRGEGTEVFIVPTASAKRVDPTPCLRQTGGSIKENMIMVAEMVDGKAKVLPEFEESFAPLFRERKTHRHGSGKGTKAGETTKNTAAAFRALYSGQ